MDFKFATFLIISAQICASLALPPCVCTRNFRPVCGSDGKTYSNECLLDCAAHKEGSTITVEKEGPCTPAAEAVCICTFDYKPVCGTDGQTYSNPCALNCQKRQYNPELKVNHEGACTEPQEPPCTCDALYRPVCGSDGNTYSNDCELNCATKNNSQLSIASNGPCDDKVRVAQSPFAYN